MIFVVKNSSFSMWVEDFFVGKNVNLEIDF